MRTAAVFAIVITMSTIALTQTLLAPQAVTDPRQISSKSKAQVERNLSIEKLYMTRAIGATAWSPNGKTIAFISNISGRNNLWLVAAEGGWPTQLTVSDQRQTAPAWSPDGKWIVYTQQQAKGTDSNIFVAEVASGKSMLLTPHQGEQLYSANDFSPDGKQVLLTANAANGYDNVGLIDIASKKITWLTQDKWEISGGNFSPDGKSITWTANVDGNTDIYLHDLGSIKTTSLPLAKGVNQVGGAESGFTRDGSRLLYHHNGPTSPNDVWVYSMADGKSRQITNSLVAGVRTEDMVEPFLVHYPSRDGKWTISALVYVPYNLPRQAVSP